MMIYKAAVAVAFTVLASSGAAQVTGGNLGVTYALPTDDGDRSVTEYFGGIEYAFSRSFAISADLAGYSFEDSEDAYVSSTLHLIYHLDENTSFGYFTGRDVVGAADANTGTTLAEIANLNGLEAGTEFGLGEIEGYFGFISGDADDATMFGASGKYDFGNSIAAIGSADFVNSDDIDRQNLSIGLEYTIAGGPELYGQIGRRAEETTASDDDSTYVEIGATINFGAERGTTFDRRSLFESLPNF